MSEQHKFVPVGYLHRLHTECGAQVRFSDSTVSPFGKCGVDYDPSYTVSCAQVYEHVAPMATEEHEEIQQHIRLGARQSGKSWLRHTTGLPCPNHGDSHCVQCFWPPRHETLDRAIFDECTVITDKQFEDFERMLAENPMQKNKALVQLMDRPTRWTPGEKTALADFFDALSAPLLTPMIIENLPPLGYLLEPLPPRTVSQDEFRKMYEQEAPQAEQSTGYTAVDMTTAAAQGFRDGAASVVVELPSYFIVPAGAVLDAAGVKNILNSVAEAIIASGGTVKE